MVMFYVNVRSRKDPLENETYSCSCIRKEDAAVFAMVVQNLPKDYISVIKYKDQEIGMVGWNGDHVELRWKK